LYFGLKLWIMEYSYLVINQNAEKNLELQAILGEFDTLHHLGTTGDCDEGFNLILKLLPTLY